MREASQSPLSDSVAPIDPGSWVEKHGDSLYNFAFNRLHSHELAEEAVQETLMSAVRAVKDFSGKSSERTWLFSILRNKISDTLRNNWNRSKVSIDDEVNPEKLMFDQNGNWQTNPIFQSSCRLETQELREIIMQCIQKLPKNQATIFILRVLQEKKSEEICQDLEISTSNYWSRLHRARLAIASCVARHWPLDN